MTVKSIKLMHRLSLLKKASHNS